MTQILDFFASLHWFTILIIAIALLFGIETHQLEASVPTDQVQQGSKDSQESVTSLGQNVGAKPVDYLL